MKPRIITHTSISLNGVVTGFEVNTDAHYSILNKFNPDAIIVGSNTVIQAKDEIPPEEKSDFSRRPRGPFPER